MEEVILKLSDFRELEQNEKVDLIYDFICDLYEDTAHDVIAACKYLIENSLVDAYGGGIPKEEVEKYIDDVNRSVSFYLKAVVEESKQQLC